MFGIATAGAAVSPTATLFYHTPNPLRYDVQWDVAGWHPENREVVLTQQVRDQNAGTRQTHTVVAKIGSEPVKLESSK